MELEKAFNKSLRTRRAARDIDIYRLKGSDASLLTLSIARFTHSISK